MPDTIVYLNGDAFVVDADALAQCERDAYTVDANGDPQKDWVRITEWVEVHGELTDA